MNEESAIAIVGTVAVLMSSIVCVLTAVHEYCRSGNSNLGSFRANLTRLIGSQTRDTPLPPHFVRDLALLLNISERNVYTYLGEDFEDHKKPQASRAQTEDERMRMQHAKTWRHNKRLKT